MAKTGLPFHGYCPYVRETQEDGSAIEILGKGRITQSIAMYQATPNSSQESLWAGDRQEETENGPVTGNINWERSRLRLEEEAEMVGGRYNKETGNYRLPGVPNPPYLRVANMDRHTIDNKPMFGVITYLSVKCIPPEDAGETKNNTPKFKTVKISGAISTNAEGDVVDKQFFESSEKALEYMRLMLNVPPQAKKPELSPAGGTVVAGSMVTITAEAGMEIRYTTDGSTVLPGSPLYENPIDISATTMIKARAYDPADKKSPSVQVSSYYMVEE